MLQTTGRCFLLLFSKNSKWEQRTLLRLMMIARFIHITVIWLIPVWPFINLSHSKESDSEISIEWQQTTVQHFFTPFRFRWRMKHFLAYLVMDCLHIETFQYLVIGFTKRNKQKYNELRPWVVTSRWIFSEFYLLFFFHFYLGSEWLEISVKSVWESSYKNISLSRYPSMASIFYS